MKLVVSILFCIALPGMSFGQTNDFLVDDSRVSGSNPGDNNNTSLTSGGSNTSSSSVDTSLPEDTAVGSTGGYNTTQMGGLDGTNDGQSKGSGVQLMGLAMGAAFMSGCSPTSAWNCVAAALSFADAMVGGSAQSAAYQTGTHLDPDAGTNGTGGGTDPIVDQQIQDGIDDLAEAGFTINGDGSVTGPEGQTFTAENLGSADGLGSMGASAEQAAEFMNGMQGVKAAAAKKAGVDLASAEGGQAMASTGGGAGGFGSSDSDSNGGADQGDSIIEEIEYRGKKKKKKRGIAESAASDLATNFNGDPIGIGMGNLFLIVHKKYRSEKKKKKFFNREIVPRKRERRR